MRNVNLFCLFLIVRNKGNRPEHSGCLSGGEGDTAIDAGTVVELPRPIQCSLQLHLIYGLQ